MFELACQEALKFLRPVVLSVLRFNGQVESYLASAVVLNAEGWIATAAHVQEPVATAAQDLVAIADYEAKVDEIKRSGGTEIKQRTRISNVRQNGNWIRRFSFWFGFDGVGTGDMYGYTDVDLLVTKLNGFDPASVGGFPRFKRPGGVTAGASLCKVGFPFQQVESKWDAARNVFELGAGARPMVPFPIEGIVTRTWDHGASADGYPVRLLETSSPGLRGQSGGPTLDATGAVWAIQSKTVHYPLASPEMTMNGKNVTVHQVLNVGLGVHTASLEALFAKHGIAVDWVD